MQARRPPRRAPAGNHGRSLGMLLLLAQNIQRMDYKPPLTLALMGIMYALHYRKTFRPSDFRRFSLCPDRVVADHDLARVFVSALLHVDDIHIYHNMLSFLWKGYHLEKRFGGVRFALVIFYLLVLSHVLVVVVAVGLHRFLALEQVLRQCSIGFSGVLFALKVVLNYGSPTNTSIYGFLVPTKYAAWVELIAIHVLVPRTSFMGHMCGILAGYVFVISHAEHTMIDPVTRLLRSAWRWVRALPRRSSLSTTAADDEELARQLQEEEDLLAAEIRSRFQTYEQAQAAEAAPAISADELRQRRMARFQRR